MTNIEKLANSCPKCSSDNLDYPDYKACESDISCANCGHRFSFYEIDKTILDKCNEVIAAKNLRIAELESLNNALMIQSQTRGEQLTAKTEAVEELVAKLDDILKYHSTTFSSQLRSDLRKLLTKHAKGT